MHRTEGEAFRGEKGTPVGAKGHLEAEYIKKEHDCDWFSA